MTTGSYEVPRTTTALSLNMLVLVASSHTHTRLLIPIFWKGYYLKYTPEIMGRKQGHS